MKKGQQGQPAGYVVWYEESLRDGREYGASVHATVEQALEQVTRMANGPFGQQMEIRLFELGPEIKLKSHTHEEPQPPRTKQEFAVA